MRTATKVRQQQGPAHLWAMLDSTVEPRDRAVLAVAMNTGLRAATISTLRVVSLDLDSLTLRAWVAKSQAEDDFPVTSDLAAEMQRWLAHYARSIKRPLMPDDHLLSALSGPSYNWHGPEGFKVRSQRASTYVPHRPATKLHRIAQAALASVGLETRHEGIHTVRRAVARVYYDSLTAGASHDGAIRVVMTLLHHTNVSTTEHYLGITSEKRTRDRSLRGRPLVPRPHSAAVTSINIAQGA